VLVSACLTELLGRFKLDEYSDKNIEGLSSNKSVRLLGWVLYFIIVISTYPVVLIRQ
jgi:hypothetical protein